MVLFTGWSSGLSMQRPNMGLGMILDSAVGMFPHKTGPLLQLLTALLSNKSTVKKVLKLHTHL